MDHKHQRLHKGSGFALCLEKQIGFCQELRESIMFIRSIVRKGIIVRVNNVCGIVS